MGSSIIYYTTTLPSIPTEKAKALPIVLLSGKEIIFFHKISWLSFGIWKWGQNSVSTYTRYAYKDDWPLQSYYLMLGYLAT